MKQTFSNPDETIVTSLAFLIFSCEKDPLKCNINIHKKNMKTIFASNLKKYPQLNTSN